MRHNSLLRTLALCLVLVLVLSLAPVSAFADGRMTVAPLTGDENNITIWIVLIVVALLAIAAAVFFLLRKSRRR